MNDTKNRRESQLLCKEMAKKLIGLMLVRPWYNGIMDCTTSMTSVFYNAAKGLS